MDGEKITLKDLSVLTIKFPGCWVVLFIWEQNAQYSLEGKSKISKIKVWLPLEVRGRGRKGWIPAVGGWRGTDWNAKWLQAALSPVLSRKLLKIRNFTVTDFLDPSGSAVSDSCLQEFTPEVKLHGNSHLFPECLPSGLLGWSSFIYLAVLGLRCCARAPSRCGEQGPCWLRPVGFSAWRPLSLQSLGSAARGLSRRGSWALEHRLRSSAARGTVSDQGSNPRPLPWLVDSHPPYCQGSPTLWSSNNRYLCYASYLPAAVSGAKCCSEDSPQHHGALFGVGESSVQSLSRVQLSATPWITAHQVSLSITNSQSLLKLNVHQVGDAIQPSHPLSSPSPPALNPSQHQGLFQWVNPSNEVAKVVEFQLQCQSFQWTPRTDLLEDGLVGSPCSPRDSQTSPAPQFKSINSLALSFFHSPTLTSIHDHWKNHSLDQMDLCWQSHVSAFKYAI